MSSFGDICISLNLQHVKFQKQLKSRHEMPFLFVVNKLGHSMGSFVILQPIFHFLLTPELIHILAQVQVSLVVRIKLKEE